MRRVRRRGLIIIAAAAAVVLVVVVRGATLYPALPGEVLVRWEYDPSIGESWVSLGRAHWVSKSPFAIFHELFLCFIALALSVAAAREGAVGALWAEARRLLGGTASEETAALATGILIHLAAWLIGGLAASMAFDNWELWSWALGYQAPGVRMASNAALAIPWVGLTVSILFTWREVKAASAEGAVEEFPANQGHTERPDGP
jgi:hypothetical protein